MHPTQENRIIIVGLKQEGWKNLQTEKETRK